MSGCGWLFGVVVGVEVGVGARERGWGRVQVGVRVRVGVVFVVGVEVGVGVRGAVGVWVGVSVRGEFGVGALIEGSAWVRLDVRGLVRDALVLS